MMTTARSEIVTGVKAVLPLLLGVSPFGMIAGLLAALVAWRIQNMFLTIGVGMVALWTLQALY